MKKIILTNLTVLLALAMCLSGCVSELLGEVSSTSESIQTDEGSALEEFQPGIGDDSCEDGKSLAEGDPRCTADAQIRQEIWFQTLDPGGITAMHLIENDNSPGIDFVAIPDVETALDIATAIFGNIQKEHEGLWDHYAQYVLYDEENEIWIVGFKKPGRLEWFGGNTSIALQKSDGRVLKVWAGE